MESQGMDQQESLTAGSEPLIRLTDKAVQMIKSLLQKESIDGHGLRVAVVGGGCSGFQYGLDFENEPGENDVVFEQDGVKIFMDEMSVQYLKGCLLDYVVSLESSRFKFINPNATRACGCGESFSA